MNENNEDHAAQAPPVTAPKLSRYTCHKCEVSLEALTESDVWCGKGHRMERIG